MIAYIANVIQRKSFSKLGEGVTFKIRCLLYSKILQKNMGWFDERDNSTGILTSVMASDAQNVNAAASQSLGPMVEGFFSMVGGIAIGCVLSWQIALICLGLIMIFIFSMAAAQIAIKK